MKRDPLVTEFRHKSNDAYLKGHLDEAAYWAEKMNERWAAFLREHPDVAARVRQEAIEDEVRRRQLAEKAESGEG